ncbi:hypothetical protein OVA24_01735 [Luteolibacter sp. SL250]|uniref:hypothetical protein n=1 Tax=Luteolibacter sp. SL250 TaxID=2995170 RepID=UPI00226E3F14|nr:hypothetical protein [Luteolibacter sp. SL250]WAC20098.1 hypothetical protein OVA24_01735 [Luteolibacter sp. SL250]
MRVLLMAMGFLLVAGTLSAAEPNVFPYDEFAQFAHQMPGEDVGGVKMVAAFLKAAKPGETLDLAKANFRIRMADGSIAPMRCDVLPAKAEDTANLADRKRIQMGFTHKLWIPKDPEKYKGAALLNDLPQGYLEIQFPLPPREAPAP